MSFEIWVQGNKNTKKQCFHLGVDDETDPGDSYKENAGNINLEGKDDDPRDCDKENDEKIKYTMSSVQRYMTRVILSYKNNLGY